MSDEFLHFQTPHFLSHDPHPTCPLYRRRLNPGWRQCAGNQWEDLKEDTSAALIRKDSAEGTVSIFFCIKGQQMCMNLLAIIKGYAWVNFFTRFSMFFLPKLIHHSVSFSGLFASSCLLTPLSLPHLPPLPQTCTHRVSSNLAACPWVHTVTKAHFSSLFRCCALVWACTTVSFASTFIFMHCQCRINYLSTFEPPTLFSSLF